MCFAGMTAMLKPLARRFRAWGLEVWCEEPKEYSSSLTAVAMPLGHDADKLREVILNTFDMSLGPGWPSWAGRCFASGIWDTSTI